MDIFLPEGDKSVKVGWIKAMPERSIGIKYFRYSYVPAKE